MGGDTSERPISFKTGRAVAAALPPGRFAVTAFDVALPATHEKSATECDVQPLAWSRLTATLQEEGFSIVLPALHGGWGEDGTLQSLLEVAGLPYAGSPPGASVIAMDKLVCKAYMREIGVPVPRGTIVRDGAQWESVADTWKTPCVVKPNSGGSSVAVTILREGAGENAAQWKQLLQRAVEEALADGSPALVEELIEGREVTAAVLGEGWDARVLPLIEIVPRSTAGFYDFEAKYAAGGSDHLIPPRLPESVQERVRELALRAHRALGCRGVARSDFIVTADGTPYFLEINTVPGMTATSLVPDAARAAGSSFEQLVETLVMNALNG